MCFIWLPLQHFVEMIVVAAAKLIFLNLSLL